MRYWLVWKHTGTYVRRKALEVLDFWSRTHVFLFISLNIELWSVFEVERCPQVKVEEW
jgi:hypothetical protein